MDYLTAVAYELLIKQGFFPVKDSSGNIVSEKNSVLLYSSEWGHNCLVELISADSLDSMALEKKFENGSSFIQNHPDIREIFYVCIFSGTPDNSLLDLMNDLQFTDYRAAKFIRSMVVNLENKQVFIFAKDPAHQTKIRKLLEYVIAKGNYVNHQQDYSGNIAANIKSLITSEDYASARKQAELPFNKNSPVFAWTILIINISIFIIMELSGGSENSRVLINFGAKFNPAIQSGEYWRLITPMFLHIGYLHLFINCFSLYNLRIIENIYGSPRFILIYLIAGIMGNVGSYLFSSSLSAGASGAIFGLMGSLLYIWKVKPRAFARVFGTSVITVIAANLIFGLSNSGIDNFAHIGGLIGGFIAALIVRLPVGK